MEGKERGKEVPVGEGVMAVEGERSEIQVE
jgi:hypothetical protein